MIVLAGETCISWLLIFLAGILPARGDEPEVITPKKVIRFFKGDKTEGLYTWLQQSKYKDPDNVLTIKDGVLHFTGDGNGYLCTRKHYRDFHLAVEYRWGERTYGDRKTLARSSGVFLPRKKREQNLIFWTCNGLTDFCIAPFDRAHSASVQRMEECFPSLCQGRR